MTDQSWNFWGKISRTGNKFNAEMTYANKRMQLQTQSQNNNIKLLKLRIVTARQFQFCLRKEDKRWR